MLKRVERCDYCHKALPDKVGTLEYPVGDIELNYQIAAQKYNNARTVNGKKRWHKKMDHLEVEQLFD